MAGLRLMVAGDAHLGYKERDAERRGDSFRGLEEVLESARTEKVDAVVLLGDLFHESNTSLATINATIDLLERLVGRKRVANESLNLDRPADFRLDPHSLPLFLIHGNHDMPVNEAKSGSLDILDKAGHVKFLGKLPSYDNVTIAPFVLEKDGLRVGLYPLGFIKDNKLNYLLRTGRMTFAPGEGLHRRLLLLHQNRGPNEQSSLRNHFDPALLPPNFFDLLLWGHEHDCIPRIVEYERLGLRVFQPGSTVATSLKPGEALPKHAGLLRVDRRGVYLQPIPLRRQRRILLENFHFVRSNCPSNRRAEEFTVEGIVRRLQLSREEKDFLPLVRVRITVDEQEALNQFELETLLRDFVANKGDVILLSRLRPPMALSAGQVLERIVNKKPLHKIDDSILRAVEGRILADFSTKQPLKVLNLEELLDLLHAYPEGLKPSVLSDMLAKNEAVFEKELASVVELRRSSYDELRANFPALIAGGVHTTSFETFFSPANLKSDVQAVFNALHKHRREQHISQDYFNDLEISSAVPAAPTREETELSATEDFQQDFEAPEERSASPRRRRGNPGRPPAEKRVKNPPGGNLKLEQFL